MKYFLDTEFIEAGGFVDIVSIGVVDAFGREFYAENSEVDWSRASQWVLDNVKPHLAGPLAKFYGTRAEIAAALQRFVSEPSSSYGPPEFWAYYAAHDWVALDSIFGSMIAKPDGWPMYCRDIKQWADEMGVARERLPPDPKDEHHALADARWAHAAWRALNDIAIDRALDDAPPALPYGPLSADEFETLLVPGDLAVRASLAYRALMLDRDNVVRERDETLESLQTVMRATGAGLSVPEGTAHPLASEFDAAPAEAFEERFDDDTNSWMDYVGVDKAAVADRLDAERAARPKPLCIYHGNCADGFTAAWAVWKKFGNTFEYHAGVYGEAAPDVTGRDVVLVDFSYKRDVLRQMRSVARSILVLDHHKTAQEDLAPNGSDFLHAGATAKEFARTMASGAYDPREAIFVLFDMDRSGAGIAWDFFHPGESRPAIVNHVEDRDLWRFALDHTREIQGSLFSLSFGDFEAYDTFAFTLETPEGRNLIIAEGRGIMRDHDRSVRELVGACKRRMRIGGYDVPAASLPYTLTSDAGNLMAQGEPFAACYWDTPNGRVFSLRSIAGHSTFDVSEIAKRYGGGGHRNAAGFTLPFKALGVDGAPMTASWKPEAAEAAAA